MEINYFAELNLPSKNAYSIHVMKMCNALTKNNINVNLYIFNKKKNINIHKIYNCKKKFKIVVLDIFKFNFFNRLKYSLKLLKIFDKKKDKKNLIISRSIIGAIIFSYFKYDIILEIHHELTGFTKYLFNFCKKFNFFRSIKFIFISQSLYKKFNLKNQHIILDDAVDIDDFNYKKKIKIKKRTCVYTGSLAKGKGLEKIFEISKFTKKIKFDVYGDFTNSDYNKGDFTNFSNVNYLGYTEYKNIPKILKMYDVVLMPYSKKVFVRAKNIETSKYMSPMKLFDYMAGKKIIIASKMPVYKHILNNNNSILVNDHSARTWAKKINYVFNNLNHLNKIKKNAFKTAKKYTWDLRVKKIIKFANA